MPKISRRSFIESAIAIGATAAWRFASPKTTKIRWTEQREFFPEGVASGDPDSSSVLLWTRHTPGTQQVAAEVAEDPAFTKVVATAHAPVSAAADWTCRVLVGGLHPSTVYWYRFTDPEGQRQSHRPHHHSSGRTRFPPVRFAFVSCQNATRERRMLTGA